MTLLETIDALKRREQAEAWDRNEAHVAQQLAARLPQPEPLDDQTREDLQPFLAWTSLAGVRYAPCKTHVVCAYVLHLAATGASTGTILRSLTAISALHERHNLADPVSSSAARYAIEYAIPADPPRSWRKDEKKLFVTMPAEVKVAVSRREHQRETEIRRLQNELAELKKTALPAAAEPKPAETQIKDKIDA